MIIKTIL